MVDLNGIVDLLDYEIIRDHFLIGTTREEGDLNFSGLVELGDFRIWKNVAFPTGGGPAGVPEPSGLVLLAAGAAGLAMWRRRRSGQAA